jgi:cytochrome P450
VSGGTQRAAGALHLIRRHRDVTAVLDDPSFVVPAAEPAENGIGWLRFHASRFANGTAHAQRRTQIEGLIGGLDVTRLRRDAEAATNAILDRAAGGVLDVMGSLARRVPIAVLATALALEADPQTLDEPSPLRVPAALVGEVR